MCLCVRLFLLDGPSTDVGMFRPRTMSPFRAWGLSSKEVLFLIFPGSKAGTMEGL